jgi:protocatechuate 3,4-dioxygenase alpha subunit
MNHWNFQELHETPSQTGGPYVHIGLLPKQANIEVFENNFNNQLVKENTLGERIRLEGQVFDGLGLPLRDVLIEIWQADANGVYPSAADIQGKAVDPNFLVGDVQAQTLKLVFGVSIPLNRVLFRDVKAQLKLRILH